MGLARLTDAEIQVALQDLPGWTFREGKLHAEYRFPTFADAIAFVAKAALLAESMDHHPEWWNSYTAVRVDLMTHDVRGISDRDLTMAAKLGVFARQLGAG